MRRSYGTVGSLGAVLACGLACGDGGGDMNPPQESVSDGTTDRFAIVDLAIEAGAGVTGLAGAQLDDRWSVRHDRLLIALGTFTFVAADGSVVAHEASGVVDLLAVEAGSPLASVQVPDGATQVRFSLPAATSRFTAVAPATTADVDLMAASGYAVYVEGTIARTDGMTCTGDAPRVCTPAPSVRFRWGVPVGLTIAGCPELLLESEQTVDQVLTLSGDHWFRTNFRGTDGAAGLRAQWIANADIDRNGETTLEELGRIDADVLLRASLGYDLVRDAPIPIVTGRDFVEAQIRMMAREALGDGCELASPL